MKPEKILYAMNDIDSEFLNEARAKAAPRRSRKFAVLIAAVIALTAMTLTAFAADDLQSWFEKYFSQKAAAYQAEQEAVNGELSQKQLDYIHKNEQVIAETQENNGWTVELKSSICDGKTAYVIFGITAPDGFILGDRPDSPDDSRIIPGNDGMKAEGKELFAASVPLISKDQNYTWSLTYGFEEDGDGKDNTIDYVFQFNIEKLYYDKDILLDDPFGAEFYFCFDKFVRSYRDTEYEQELLNTKYKGQTDYMLEPEEVARIHQVEVLTDGLWEFSVSFADTQADTLEMISEPIYVEALVSVEIESDALFTDRKNEIMDVKVTSFKLTALGATITCDFEGDVVSALFEYQNLYGYEDRHIFVVMKDGTKIPLHTDGRSDNFAAEVPIVLSEVDHVLLSDGTKLTVP